MSRFFRSHLNPKRGRAHPNAALRRQEGLIGLLFLSPWILGYILLKALPILTAFWYSLTDFQLLHPDAIHFIGLQNYLSFLTDLTAWTSLAGSLGYFLTTVPLEMVVALILAAVLSSEQVRAKAIWRPLIFLPSIVPATAVVYIWFGMTDPGSGWINRLITQPLGLPPIGVGLNADLILALWSIGPGFLIMYGAMQGVSRELYEAALLDGAGPLMRFIGVTVPIISPAIFFSLVINLTTAFGGSLLLDRGMVFSQSLSPMDGYINLTLFQNFNAGYASALAWVMFGLTMTITFILFRSAQRWVYFPEETGNESI